MKHILNALLLVAGVGCTIFLSIYFIKISQKVSVVSDQKIHAAADVESVFGVIIRNDDDLKHYIQKYKIDAADSDLLSDLVRKKEISVILVGGAVVERIHKGIFDKLCYVVLRKNSREQLRVYVLDPKVEHVKSVESL